MVEHSIQLSIPIAWLRLNGVYRLWRWGDKKNVGLDSNWAKRNVIYRWVKNSTGEVATIGETERMLTERADTYLQAKRGGGADPTKNKLYQEQSRLERDGDFLYLEFTEDVLGYDLTDQSDRRMAESLLVRAIKPYFQSTSTESRQSDT
ncbi:MAG: hypothetical protein L0Z68_06870 [Gammaproteobacteria bacterium]|nr:hypothetical protein [Gammaproteobacteria bacterium]